MLQLHQLDFLCSPAGTRALDALAAVPVSERNHLTIAERLRREYGVERGRALLEITLLRQKAHKKFIRADAMFFDRVGLEMASAEIVSTYRAQRFSPFEQIADLGCGIGGDALALAQVANVIAIDRNPVRLAMARENVRVYGGATCFRAIEADLNTIDSTPCDALFFDPARRTAQGKRIFSLHHYQPPLSILEQWGTRNWGVKISPGVDYEEVPNSAEIEFISVNGEVREAVLWYSNLRRGTARTATLLRKNRVEHLDSNAPIGTVGISEPKEWLYEPDGAIIRAHLVEHLATQLGATQPDKTIAYLTSDVAHNTPFARRWRVVDWFPFQLKRLRRYLREHNVGDVIIKKRGSPLDPAWLRTKLKLKGSERRIIFLTRLKGEAVVIVGRLETWDL